MLLLTRKKGERIRLTLPDGRAIWVTLVSVERFVARIGFECPREIEIEREELFNPKAKTTEEPPPRST